MRQRDIKSHNDHMKLWNYSQLQYDKIALWDKRFLEWKTITDDIYTFIYALHSKETSLLADYDKLKKSLQSRVEHEKVTSVWHSFAVGNLKDQASWVSSLNLILQECIKLKSEIKKRQKNYISDTNKFISLIKQAREDVVNAIAKTEKSSIISSTQTKVDPWLTKRQLHLKLNDMILKENQFQKRISFLFEDMVKLDQFTVAELQRIFDQFGSEQTKHFRLVQAHVADLRGVMNIIDSTESCHAFVSNQHLFESCLWAQERCLEEFPYKIPDTKILKSGNLYRPGTLSKWKPCHFVLTETGYLHCFDGAIHASKNHLSRANSEASTLTTDSNQMDLESIERDPKHGLNYSIPLNQPRLQVVISTDYPSLNVFEIHSSLLSSAGKKSQKSFFWSKDSTQKWIIKADSEEEMVDWIVEIKNQIEMFLPQVPEMENVEPLNFVEKQDLHLIQH